MPPLGIILGVLTIVAGFTLMLVDALRDVSDHVVEDHDREGVQ